MTDHQRVHPVVVNVEAPPPPTTTRPLVPPGSTRSEKGVPAQHRISLGPIIAARPPPLKPPKRGNCWCKCLCWTISLLILLLIIVGATAGILYLVFQPKLPKYSVDNLKISDLTLNFDLSLYARFNVRITALPRINPEILPGPPEQNSVECGLNRPKSIREDSAGCITGAATDWKDSTGS